MTKKLKSLAGWLYQEDDYHYEVLSRKHGVNAFIWWLGSLAAVRPHFEKTRVALDVGCHYGHASFWLSQHFDKVYGFDINEDTSRCCAHNMKTFMMDNVHTYPYGLGNKNAEYSLALPNDYSLSHAVNYKNYNQSKVGRGYTKTLDSLKLEHVDFIKMDVEGFEQNVVKGGLETIDRCSPVIFYEAQDFHKRYGIKQTVLEILEPYGYRIIESMTIGKKNNHDFIIKRIR